MWKLYLMLFVSAILCSAESLPELGFHAPGSVMLPNEKKIVTLTPAGETFHWTILDWKGKALTNGTARGEFSLPETLLPGYYSLEISSAGKILRKNFGILPSAAISGSPEMPYCIDFASAIGTVSRYDPNDLRRSLEFFADLCAKAGIRFVRERLWWSASAEKTECTTGGIRSLLPLNCLLSGESGFPAPSIMRRNMNGNGEELCRIVRFPSTDSARRLRRNSGIRFMFGSSGMSRNSTALNFPGMPSGTSPRCSRHLYREPGVSIPHCGSLPAASPLSGKIRPISNAS